MIAAVLARLSAWRAKRAHARRWPVELQLDHLRTTLQQDCRWLASDNTASELCSRYSRMLSDDWEKQYVEDISQFRDRIGLNPHRTVSVAAPSSDKQGEA